MYDPHLLKRTLEKSSFVLNLTFLTENKIYVVLTSQFLCQVYKWI